MSLSSAAPVIGSALDFISGLGNSLFNANQARKNRAFQEKMYEKQYQDNLRLWHMNNAYNTPAEMLKRVESAGLNPLLMYEGGTALSSSSVAQGANAPSGDSARGTMQSNFAQGATQAALLQAQIRNIDADTEQKLQAADESWTHTDWYRSTKGIQYGILKKSEARISYEITKIATETNSLASITWKQLEVMDKGIEMMDKNYNLSERDLENRIAYNIAQIALGNRQVDATLKQIGVAMYEAVTHRKMAISEIAKNTAEIKKIVADTALSEAEKEAKINDIISGQISNKIYNHYGVKDLSGVTGALLLIAGSIFPDDSKADIQEIKDMYKAYGINIK